MLRLITSCSFQMVAGACVSGMIKVIGGRRKPGPFDGRLGFSLISEGSC